MRTLWSSARVLGASLTTLATAGGLYAMRAAQVPAHEAYGEEDFDAMLALPARTVVTDDGVALAVRETGPADPSLTVIFVHGYCLRMQSWHLQMRHLEEHWGKNVRMVFYDQRGHGESDLPTSESCTIAQLGRDLAEVIDTVAPTGPIVVVGHSMGGMTALALASQHPELFDERIVGVGLLATTAAGLTGTGLGRNLTNPVIDGFRYVGRAAPNLVQFARGAAIAIISPILRAASFGTVVSPRIAEFSDRMLSETSVPTLVNFLPTLEVHNESAALPVLGKVPTLVLCGDADMLTPFTGSEALAAALQDSELERVRGAGHLVPLEFPETVSGAVDRLLRRAWAHHRIGRLAVG